MQKPAILTYFLENADSIVAILGIISGLSITSLYLISKTIHLFMLGIALVIASLVYLILKNRSRNPDVPLLKSGKIISEIIFFFFFSISLVILFTNTDRPLAYFILVAACSGCIALSISQVASKTDCLLQILKIFLLSFNLKSIWIFSVGSGVDYWTHLAMNNRLAQTGFIDVLNYQEPFFPLMHIQTAALQILTGIPVKEASFIAVSLPLVISSVCVFLVARTLFNTKAGLLALLIVNSTDYITYWGYATQTTTFGICLFYFLIFVIFHMAATKINRIIWSMILILFFISLIIAHAVSSFIALMTITGLCAGSYAYKVLYDDHAEVFPPILAFFLYGILLFQHWFVSLYSTLSGSSFFGTIVSTLDFYVTEHAAFLNRPESIVAYAAALPPFIERAANTTGLALLMLLAAVGSLIWLSKNNNNRYRFSIIVCTVLLLFITFGFPLFGIRNIIPSRWFAFMYFFLSIMAACAVLFILARIPRQTLKHFFLLVVISSLSFFMITSTVSNLDSPLWLQESTTSTGYSFQEIAGARTIVPYSGRIISDNLYGLSVIGTTFGHQWSQMEYGDPSEYRGGIFIRRNSQTVRDTNRYSAYEEYPEKMQKIFENNDIRGYFIR